MRAADPDEIEVFLRETFAKNSERIRFESGHALAPETKEAALEQVLLYWRRLRNVAEKITSTEVRLHLPNQTTPKGRKFNIEGVVDIVQEGKRTIMYDLKTHDADYVRANLSLYEEQLNVYAHIWQKLRGSQLDGTAILATRFPKSVKEALKSGDRGRLDNALKKWEPIVPIRMDATRVEKAIVEFGKVVDSIEERNFKPRRVSILKTNESPNGRFAVTVCANCDARFSCDSYQTYSDPTQKRGRSTQENAFQARGNQEERGERLDLDLAEA